MLVARPRRQRSYERACTRFARWLSPLPDPEYLTAASAAASRSETGGATARATATVAGRGEVAAACGGRVGAACGVVGVSGRSGKARGPGHRSIDALRWLSRVEVSGIEPLGHVLGFGWRATYSHVAQLAEAGLLARFHDRDGSVVAITLEGRRAVGADGGGAVRVGRRADDQL
jgi:hypothetical protein